uniref:Putative secreted protein n=1 Tax=Anopheles darlingi TaxID=43151 RepID=A0A2M4D478_ANODA
MTVMTVMMLLLLQGKGRENGCAANRNQCNGGFSSVTFESLRPGRPFYAGSTDACARVCVCVYTLTVDLRREHDNATTHKS